MFAVSSGKIETAVIAKIQHGKFAFSKAFASVTWPLTLVKMAPLLTLACR